MSYVYSNDRMVCVYLREVHMGTWPEVRSSATGFCYFTRPYMGLVALVHVRVVVIQ